MSCAGEHDISIQVEICNGSRVCRLSDLSDHLAIIDIEDVRLVTAGSKRGRVTVTQHLGGFPLAAGRVDACLK